MRSAASARAIGSPSAATARSTFEARRSAVERMSSRKIPSLVGKWKYTPPFEVFADRGDLVHRRLAVAALDERVERGVEDLLAPRPALLARLGSRPSRAHVGLQGKTDQSVGSILARGRPGPQGGPGHVDAVYHWAPPGWRNGRRSRLKIGRAKARASSTLAPGTSRHAPRPRTADAGATTAPSAAPTVRATRARGRRQTALDAPCPARCPIRRDCSLGDEGRWGPGGVA